MKDKEMTIIEWALSDDTGMSSKSLCKHMLGIKQDRMSYPYDAGDRGRCIRLLNLVPEWWDRLDEMASIPGGESIVISSGGMRVEKNGWADQISLIKKEVGL